MKGLWSRTAGIVLVCELGCCLLTRGGTAASDMPKLEFAFEEVVTLGPGMKPGTTPWGERNIIPITGGTFAGPHIKGKILNGGWDWQLTSASGCNSIQADYMIQTDDGTIINVVNKGSQCPDENGKLPPWITVPVFEAPQGKYGWLNGGVYIGTLAGATVNGNPAVRLRFYRASVLKQQN